MFPTLYDLAHVGWDPYNLHGLAHVSWVASVLQYADLELTTAGEELDI